MSTLTGDTSDRGSSGIAPSGPVRASSLSPSILKVLSALRSKVRRYIWFLGLTLGFAWLGLAFWVTLAIDWIPVTMGYDEPTLAVRIGMLAVTGAVLLGILFWSIIRRISVPMSDRSMAMLLERRYGQFDDGLITSVEMVQRPDHAELFNPEMLRHTQALAEQQSGQVQLASVFNPGPLLRSAFLAVVLVVSVVAFAMAAPGPFGIWLDRVLLLDDATWPRYTRLEVEGFDDGTVKVARGRDYKLTVLADGQKTVPATVRILFDRDDGTTGRRTMSRIGRVEDGYQTFTYNFEEVRDSFTFDVVGGDYRVRDLRVEVVENPAAELQLHCTFPDYMVREELGLYTPRVVPLTRVVQLPQGTRIDVVGKANKKLTRVEVEIPQAEGTSLRDDLPLAASETDTFEYTIPSLNDDVTVLFHLADADGIESREPIRLALVALLDQPPELALRLRGIGEAVTPDVRIPVIGEVRDDYGVDRLWFEFAVDDQNPTDVAFGEKPERRDLITITRDNEAVLDFRQLSRLELEKNLQNIRDPKPDAKPTGEDPSTDPSTAAGDDEEAEDKPAAQPAVPATNKPTENLVDKFELVPGQRLTVTVKAADAYALGAEPHTGNSQPFSLEVVTPERLRAILDARELVLRRRFETIIEEFTESRDTLRLVKFGNPEPANEPATGDGDTEEDSEANLDADLDDGDEAEPESSEALLGKASIYVQRAQQNSAKNALEVLGVATGFDEIREELVNNRMYTEELNERLQNGIAEPLKNVANVMFKDLDEQLDHLHAQLTNPNTREASLAGSQQKMDEILVEMDTILARMLELETLNELIELIAAIIESQEDLTEQMKAERKRQLLDQLKGLE